MDHIYVRHGESMYNIRKTTSLDSELTDLGVLQIRSTARRLKAEIPHIEKYYGFCSPYLRTLQSARIIRELTGIDFVVRDGPREVMTCYDEVSVPNRSKEFPDLIWDASLDGWHFKKETDDEFIDRMSMFHNKLGGKSVVVLSHGTPIVSLYELDQGISNPPNIVNYPRNASVSRVLNGNHVCYDSIVDY